MMAEEDTPDGGGNDDDLLGGRDLYPTEDQSGPTTVETDDDQQLYVNELFGTDARRDLLDFFLTTPDAEFGERGMNQSQIADGSSVSRNSVRRHLPVLVEMGIVEEAGDGAIRHYRLAEDSDPTRLIAALNDALARSYTEE